MRRLAFPLGFRTSLDPAPFTAAPLPYTPTIFAFADDFSVASDWPGRPGWRTIANDARVWTYFKVQGGATSSSFGYGTAGNFALVDVGRTDSQYVQASVPAAGSLKLMLRVSDEKNNISITVTAGSNVYMPITKVAKGVSTNIFSGNPRPASIVAGDMIRLESAGDTIFLSINGARYPDASTSWSAADLARSGTIGIDSYQGVVVDNFAGGYSGAAALVRVTLDPVRRVIQRDKGATSKAVPLTGQHSGLNGAPEMRLLVASTNAVVAGWDWGQQPLTGFAQDGATWSARTAAIPQGDGYRIEVRDPANHDAGSRSNPFGVGIVFATYGQSNATGIAGGSYFTPATPIAISANPGTAAANQPQPALQVFDTTAWPRGGDGRAADTLSAAAANLPVAVIPGGYGGQPIAALVPGSATIQPGWTTNLWTGLEQTIAASGGDIEALVYIQGESDAGSGGGADFAPATYKAGLDAMYARLKAITGRGADQLAFVIHGLGRVANAPAGYPAGTNWRELRKAQFEWCRDTPGALLGSTAIDVAMDMSPAWPSPAWHRLGTDAGYGEDGKRIGAALAKRFGYASTDRRGPVPTGMTRSGSTLVIAFDPNGAGAMTCAAPIATNFEFATDATFATALTPTAMTIDNSAHGVTFTFSSALPTGAAVRGPTGINPDVANPLKAAELDGAGVMSWPIFDKLVAV